MLNILVLMAGRGLRFADQGYSVPKPLINVNGKTILQWTTESCPYIKHNQGDQDETVNLSFAVLKEHQNNGLDDFLKAVYGQRINIVSFKEITRGNLETASIACKDMLHGESPLLILDSDNKYDHNDIDLFLKTVSVENDAMAICCFEDQNKSLPNKWSNAKVENGIAKGIKEKDDSWINEPSLIGVFYFSTLNQFKNYAKFILEKQRPLSIKGKDEYYMSMIPTYHADAGKPVHVHFVKSVVSLGTPSDVELFRNSENKFDICI